MFDKYTPEIIFNTLQQYPEVEAANIILMKELLLDINSAIDDICSDKEKEFILLWKTGLSVNEIAEQLGCQTFWIWKMKRKIPKKLAEYLETLE